jgi:serine/threonine protein kinase
MIAGKYRLLSKLGSGAMGVVYLAQHELLDRHVAIKVLHAHRDDLGEDTARFEREIKAMGLVGNPHVAHAFDADVLEDGSLYLVMEYLDGRDLRAECTLRGRIPFPEAVAYIVQACEGVAAVHDLGIIHRDLKPHNLYLTQLTGARRVKVLDFGVAKFLDGPDVSSTSTGVSVGTPLYMSPEQLNNPGAVSARSDVWSLGVVLYELIAGISPFAADTPGEVIAAVILDNPIPLSAFVPDLPEPLARVISDTLAKSPIARIPSAREFAERLAPFGMPTDAIIIDSAARSEQPVVALKRTVMQPELAQRILDEVAAFDGDPVRGECRPSVDALRHVPSLAKLTVGPTVLASPGAHRNSPRSLDALARETIGADRGPLESSSSSAADEAALFKESTSPRVVFRTEAPGRSRWLPWAFGVILFGSGMLGSALVFHTRALAPSGAILSTLPLFSPPLPSVTPVQPKAPISVATPSEEQPSTIVSATRRTSAPSEHAQARGAATRPAPMERKSVVADAMATTPAPLPEAADGRPLHHPARAAHGTLDGSVAHESLEEMR